MCYWQYALQIIPAERQLSQAHSTINYPSKIYSQRFISDEPNFRHSIVSARSNRIARARYCVWSAIYSATHTLHGSRSSARHVTQLTRARGAPSSHGHRTHLQLTWSPGAPSSPSSHGHPVHASDMLTHVVRSGERLATDVTEHTVVLLVHGPLVAPPEPVHGEAGAAVLAAERAAAAGQRAARQTAGHGRRPHCGADGGVRPAGATRTATALGSPGLAGLSATQPVIRGSL